MEKPNRIFILLLRLVLAGYFFMAAWPKISGGFSIEMATGMLQRAEGFFSVFMGPLLPVINILVTYGELLLAISLLLGVSMRLSTTLGAVLMGFIYLFFGQFIFDHLLIVLLSLLVVGYSRHHLYALANHKEHCSKAGCPCKYLPN